jgi:hypothetical protein
LDVLSDFILFSERKTYILKNEKKNLDTNYKKMIKRRVYMLNKKGVKQKENYNSPANQQKASDIIASIDEMKKEHKPEYVNIYWDEWR